MSFDCSCLVIIISAVLFSGQVSGMLGTCNWFETTQVMWHTRGIHCCLRIVFVRNISINIVQCSLVCCSQKHWKHLHWFWYGLLAMGLIGRCVSESQLAGIWTILKCDVACPITTLNEGKTSYTIYRYSGPVGCTPSAPHYLWDLPR